jgi:electron transport complex protein RnfG
MSERLPMVGHGSDADASDSTDTLPVRVESSSVRLVGTLAVAGALAGLAIVMVFQWADPRIEAWRAEVLSEAVTEVLRGAERYETVFLEEGAFTGSPVSDTTGLDRVYIGYGPADEPVGVALVGAGAGFQDVIRLIFGYDPDDGAVIGMQVLESKETPGLGDKIEKDSAFVGEFARVEAPLVGLKAGRETGAETEVTMITGATISSRAIVDIINARLLEVGVPVEAYWAGARAHGGGSGGVGEGAGTDGADSPAPRIGGGG